MKTCKDCALWKQYNDGHGTHFRYCDGESSTMSDQPNTLFHLKLDAADDTDLSGYLLTGPDFGCVLHISR